MTLHPPPTNGELLLVRRKRLGVSQSEAARRCCVPRMVYNHWENDAGDGAPKAGTLVLDPHEVLTIKRRRSGLTQQQLADTVGVTRQTVVEVEAGRASQDRLITYWELVDDAHRSRGR
jgi:DNA-binding XRE family transcriptional regulator